MLLACIKLIVSRARRVKRISGEMDFAMLAYSTVTLTKNILHSLISSRDSTWQQTAKQQTHSKKYSVALHCIDISTNLQVFRECYERDCCARGNYKIYIDVDPLQVTHSVLSRQGGKFCGGGVF